MNQDVSLKFKNSVTGQAKLDRYYKSLTNINTILGGTSKGAGIDVTSQMNNNTKATEKFGNSLTKAFNFTAIIIGLKKVINLMTNNVELTSSYIEKLNLMDVAFNSNTTSAEKFINTLSEMYGIDESTLTDTVGTFKQLANAMGIAGETGTNMSKVLTQLSIDASSLYNTDFETAVTKMESALAGQTKAIRSFGADITESSLALQLQKEGIDKNVDSLTYAEKRLVIVMAVMDQLSNAQNDYGRTSESLANQTKVLSEQWSRLGRAMGNVFFPILKAVLPYLNAVLMVLVEIINTIANLVGFDLSGEDYFSATDDSVLDLVDDLDSATDSAKKLKSGLRGFDKLNVITTPSSSSTSTSGGTGGTGLDSSILDAFNKAYSDYDSKLESISMKATKIRDDIMEWLGFTKIIDKVTGKVSFKFDHITGGTVLGALAVGGTIYGGIATVTKLLAKIGIISKPLPSLFSLIWKAIKGIAESIGSVVTAIATATGLSVGWVVAIGIAIVAVVALIVIFRDEIANFFIDLWKNFNNNVIQPITNFFTTIAQFVWNNAIKPIIDFFYPIVDAIGSIFSEILKNILEIVVGVEKAILSIISKINEIFLKIIEINVALGKSLYTYIILPIYEFTGKVFSIVYERIIKPILNIFVNVGSWFYYTLIKPIWDKILWLKDKVVETFKTIGITIVNFMGNLFKGVINSIFSMIENNINFFIKMLNGAIDIINAIPDVNITKLNLLSIPRLKVGMDFVPNDYFPAYLDYGERVLTKEENQEYMKNKGYASDVVNNSYTNNNQSSFSPTIVVQVGNEELARKVISNLQDMAISDGKPITIGG